MNMVQKMMVGTAGLAMIAGAAAPAAAQQYGYPGQQYGNQGGGIVGQIINNVLGGGRYGSYGQGNDRMAVDQCARAAEARVSGDRNYGPYGQSQYGQSQYGQSQYGQGYNGNRGDARVVAVTQVTRSNNGLRVMGLIDTGRNWRNQGQGYGNQGYNNQYPSQGYIDPRYPQQGYNQGIDPRFGGFGNQGYANAGQYAELRFNCRVDFRGQVTRVNIERNGQFRR